MVSKLAIEKQTRCSGKQHGAYIYALVFVVASLLQEKSGVPGM